MTDIEAKALALVNEIERERGETELTPRIMRGLVIDEALCRAIEQHEALEARLAEADALIEKARSAMVLDKSWNVDAYILVPQFDAYLGQSK